MSIISLKKRNYILLMIDFEKIKSYYQLGDNLSLTDAQEIIDIAQAQSFNAGEHLIKKGTTKRELFFILKGLIRSFIINDKGDEITNSISWENHFASNADAILFNQPSCFYYEALEPTDVLSMDYDLLESIVSNNPKLLANRKHIVQNMLKGTLKKIDTFILLSPEERYIDFVETNPDIINRVPDKYIANVLGITPVSLSRIRKRIASKKID